MQWFNDLSLSKKLIFSFILMALITAVVGYFGYTGVNDISTTLEKMYKDRTVPIKNLGYANAALLIARTEVRNLLAAKDDAKKEEFIGLINKETENVFKYINEYKNSELLDEEKKLLANFEDAWENYINYRTKAIDLIKQNRNDEALTIINGPARDLQTASRKNLRALIDLNVDVAKKQYEESTELVAATDRTLIIVIILAIVLAIGFGIILSRIIGNPVKELK